MLSSRKWVIGFSGIFIASFLLLIVSHDAKSRTVFITNAATSPFYGNTISLMAKTANNTLPNHAKECISFYDLLQKGKKAKIGELLYLKTRTNLTPVRAYAFSDYSVVTLEAAGWFGRRVYCHYFDANWNKLRLPVESVVFPEHSVHCCRHPEAFYMGITQNKNDEVVFKVPVLDRTVDKPKYNLSVCLAPIYGNESKWLLLTESIEHYKLQGVQHFYIYVKDIDDYSRLLIDDYEKSGEVEVVYFKEQDRLGTDWHLVGIVDCLQRSRHHSRYAIFIDLDERILALGNRTLAEYIPEAMASKPNIGMLQFQTTFVIRTEKPPDEYEGERTLMNHLPTLVFHNTSAIAPPGYMVKCVVDPRRVVFMHVHNVFLYFPGYKRLRVPPDKALIRHYRDLSDNSGRPWLVPSIMSRINELKSFGNFTITEYPKNLMLELYKNVKSRLSQLYKRS